MNGWIKLNRSILDSSIFLAKPEFLKVWVFILTSVNHEEKRFPFNGADVVVPAGSFITGLLKASKKCDISIRTLRSALNYLKTTSRVTIKSNNKYSVVSVNNWNEYQSTDTPNDKPTTNQRQQTRS